MPTADELVLKIVLDASGFEEGRKKYENELKKAHEDTEKILKAIEEQGKKALEFFNNLKEKALGLFAVFTGGWGLKELIEKTVLGTAEFGRAAENIGISTEALYGWEVAVREVGGSTDSLHNSLMNISQDFAMASITGQSKFEPVLRSIGVQVSYLKDGSVDLNKMLLDLAKWGEGKPRQQAIALYRMLGLDPAMIDVLLKGVAALEQKLKVEGTIAPKKEDIERTERLQAVWSNFLTTMQNFAASAVLSLLGKNFDKTLQGWTQWLDKNKEDILKNIVYYVGKLGDALWTVVTAIEKVDYYWRIFVNWLLGLPVIGDLLRHWGVTQYQVPAEFLKPNEVTRQRPRELPRDPVTGDTTADPNEVIGPRGGQKGDFKLPSDIPPEARDLMTDIAVRESNAEFDALYGGGHFDDMSKHPNTKRWTVRGRVEDPAGAWQDKYSTWQEVLAANPDIKDFLPESQARGNWWLMKRDYKARTGRDLLADLKQGGRIRSIRAALKPTYDAIPDEDPSLDKPGDQAPGHLTPYPTEGDGSKATANPYDIEHMTPHNRKRYDDLLKSIPGRQGALMPGPGAGRTFASNTTNSVQTHVGHLAVHTAATNAQDMVRDVTTYMNRFALVGPFRGGLA